MTASYAPHHSSPAERLKAAQPGTPVAAAEPDPTLRRGRRPANQPGVPLEGLAFGAPLTAAFIGAMIGAEGAASASAPATAPGSTATYPGVARHPTGNMAAEAEPGAQALAVADPSEAPVTPGDAAVQPLDPATSTAQEHRSDGLGHEPAASPSSLVIEGPEPAPADAKAAATAGPQVSLTFMDASMTAGSAGQDAAGGASANPIGSHVTGSAGGDIIDGTPFDDHLSGGTGNDVIRGFEGDDLLDGGSGHDLLLGGPGDDRLLGAAGHDDLRGGLGDDDLLGGAGNDRLDGGAGRDRLDGGPGQDVVDGGPGADRLSGGSGDDLLMVGNIHDVPLESAGGGRDTVIVEETFAGHLEQELGHEAASFVLSGKLGGELPDGAPAHRQQIGVEIENITLLGDGDHAVLGDAGTNHLTGNDGDNVLHGAGGQDFLIGGAGADTLRGGAGPDHLQGGSGDDLLTGEQGVDRLHGGQGDDLLDGGLGADLLYGNAGDDTFVLGLNDSAVDTVFDHEGVNSILLEGADGHLVETAVVGDELWLVVDKNPVGVVEGFAGHEAALAGIRLAGDTHSPSDLLAENAIHGDPALTQTTVEAAAGRDLLDPWLPRPSDVGSDGDDVLAGSSAPDWLSGGGGDDLLQAGAGDDVLEGGAGRDQLEGGAGDDRYLFGSDQAGLDTIRDADGANIAQLDGFTGARLEGAVVGRDLLVVADGAPLFEVEGYVGNEQAFAGVQNGDSFVATEDLFAS